MSGFLSLYSVVECINPARQVGLHALSLDDCKLNDDGTPGKVSSIVTIKSTEGSVRFSHLFLETSADPSRTTNSETAKGNWNWTISTKLLIFSSC